jgi:uncharacterized membrane protein YkoI
MKKRIALLAALAVIALGGTGLAVGGGSGLIFDDGHYAKPGTLDDGKQYLPQTRIGVEQAVAMARRALDGPLGQVDLKNVDDAFVYVVDIGDREVNVDAVDGSVVGIAPRS